MPHDFSKPSSESDAMVRSDLAQIISISNTFLLLKTWLHFNLFSRKTLNHNPASSNISCGHFVLDLPRGISLISFPQKTTSYQPALIRDKYDEAIKWCEKAVKQNPKNVFSRVVLCSIYSLARRMDEARPENGTI